MNAEVREPRMCEGCEAGEHWRCGMQTWCECDCPGFPDAGDYFPDPFDDIEEIHVDEDCY